MRRRQVLVIDCPHRARAHPLGTWLHRHVGSPGGFTALRAIRDHEHYTEDEVVVEGRLFGVHTGEFQGYVATEREVVLPFVSFYRFDASGLLASERVVMNLGVLAIGGADLESRRHSG